MATTIDLNDPDLRVSKTSVDFQKVLHQVAALDLEHARPIFTYVWGAQQMSGVSGNQTALCATSGWPQMRKMRPLRARMSVR